jgi:hypothetical protein
MNFVEQLNTAVSKEHGWRRRAVSSLCKFLRVCETLKCAAKQTSKGSSGILIFYRGAHRLMGRNVIYILQNSCPRMSKEHWGYVKILFRMHCISFLKYGAIKTGVPKLYVGSRTNKPDRIESPCFTHASPLCFGHCYHYHH